MTAKCVPDTHTAWWWGHCRRTCMLVSWHFIAVIINAAATARVLPGS